MAHIDAIYAVLDAAKPHPLNVEQIAKRLRKHFTATQRKRVKGGPQGIIRSRVYCDMKKKGKTSRFVKVTIDGLVHFTVRGG